MAKKNLKILLAVLWMVILLLKVSIMLPDRWFFAVLGWLVGLTIAIGAVHNWFWDKGEESYLKPVVFFCGWLYAQFMMVMVFVIARPLCGLGVGIGWLLVSFLISCVILRAYFLRRYSTDRESA